MKVEHGFGLAGLELPHERLDVLVLALGGAKRLLHGVDVGVERDLVLLQTTQHVLELSPVVQFVLWWCEVAWVCVRVSGGHGGLWSVSSVL
jgi:hypothetical protein